MVRITLTLLPRRVRNHIHAHGNLPTYRQCYNAAVNGLFPAEFACNRWTVDEADLDIVAKALGLIPGKGVERTARSRKPTAVTSDTTA